jgi:flagellar basal-body rod modification protein FlgD
MMDVGAVSASVYHQAPVSGKAPSRASLNYDAFLQLLIAQMKNQDPTQPMDSTEYIAQLAAFSNVEQAILTNNKLDAAMTALSLSQAADLIGRTITAEDAGIQGTIKALRVVNGGAVAVLNDGREVLLGPGLTVT